MQAFSSSSILLYIELTPTILKVFQINFATPPLTFSKIKTKRIEQLKHRNVEREERKKVLCLFNFCVCAYLQNFHSETTHPPPH